MSIRIGINGFGRISRVILRIAASKPSEFEIAAINYRNVDLEYMVYMLKYDSVYGRFDGTLETYKDEDEQGIVINGKKVPVIEGINPIPWGRYNAEYIVEGTGKFNTMEKASMHMEGGAKKVIITAPAKDSGIPTFVMGVNHLDYLKHMDIVSNASCTTNCLAPVAKVLNDKFGIKQGLMSTIHSATAKQHVVDMRSGNDWRRGRSVFENIIPTTTGAAEAVGLVLPELSGKLTGIAYRIPSADVSLVDLNVSIEKPASKEEICEAMKEASEDTMKGVLGYTKDPIVSADILGEKCTSIFDATQCTVINERLVKVLAWYDNEFGYSTKVLELISHMNSVDIAV